MGFRKYSIRFLPLLYLYFTSTLPLLIFFLHSTIFLSALLDDLTFGSVLPTIVPQRGSKQSAQGPTAERRFENYPILFKQFPRWECFVPTMGTSNNTRSSQWPSN